MDSCILLLTHVWGLANTQELGWRSRDIMHSMTLYLYQRSQTQKTMYYMISLYEISRIDKSSKLVFVELGLGGEGGGNGEEGLLWGEISWW